MFANGGEGANRCLVPVSVPLAVQGVLGHLWAPLAQHRSGQGRVRLRRPPGRDRPGWTPHGPARREEEVRLAGVHGRKLKRTALPDERSDHSRLLPASQTTMSQVRARNPGMTQPDVMREVSELWAKAKKVADELTKTQEDALTQGMAGLTV